ncbi:hypothetical protein RUND412_010255 [Rhizina undulata]
MSAAEILSPMSPTGSIPLPIASLAGEQRNFQPSRINTQPPDQDGAFHMDKVIKSGWLMKRTRKTKNWKRRWFVLRGDRLSAYKDQKEYKVHRQIYLSELTTVAVLKDVKKPHVFGLFSPSKNYQFQAESATETTKWADAIRMAAAISEVEGEEFFPPISPVNANDLTSPINNVVPYNPEMRLSSSSPEFVMNPGAAKIRTLGGGCLSSQTLDYSGAEIASCSSMSEGARISQWSLNHPDPGMTSSSETPDARTSVEPPRQGVSRNETGFSTHDNLSDSRVIWHGYMYCLKSKGGVKQWKKYWVVVRTINIAFYKTEEEYRAIRIIPLESVVDAVEIDPLSKSKKHCMQVITEGKSYRFSARDEEALAKCLGAMKSALSKLKSAIPMSPTSNPQALASAPPALALQQP